MLLSLDSALTDTLIGLAFDGMVGSACGTIVVGSALTKWLDRRVDSMVGLEFDAMFGSAARKWLPQFLEYKLAQI